MMGWAVSFDDHWNRDIGYGVPSLCDYPDCDADINRGLSYVCGNEPFGGEAGCGLFFCVRHGSGGFEQLCERCAAGSDPFEPRPDTPDWIAHKLTHESWAAWRSGLSGVELAQLWERIS
jgi:hypothetical protein